MATQARCVSPRAPLQLTTGTLDGVLCRCVLAFLANPVLMESHIPWEHVKIHDLLPVCAHCSSWSCHNQHHQDDDEFLLFWKDTAKVTLITRKLRQGIRQPLSKTSESKEERDPGHSIQVDHTHTHTHTYMYIYLVVFINTRLVINCYTEVLSPFGKGKNDFIKFDISDTPLRCLLPFLFRSLRFLVILLCLSPRIIFSRFLVIPSPPYEDVYHSYMHLLPVYHLVCDPERALFRSGCIKKNPFRFALLVPFVGRAHNLTKWYGE
jgi:hypothetical protein